MSILFRGIMKNFVYFGLTLLFELIIKQIWFYINITNNKSIEASISILFSVSKPKNRIDTQAPASKIFLNMQGDS